MRHGRAIVKRRISDGDFVTRWRGRATIAFLDVRMRVLRTQLDLGGAVQYPSQSGTDNTIEIAKKFGARVVKCSWRGFGRTKGEALSHASGRWVLSLDADEEVTSELAEQIRKASNDPQNEFAAYRLTRQANFLGRWMQHSGWYPDYVLRLYRNGSARVTEDPVHERIVAEGKTGTLPGILRHYTDPTIDHYLEKMRLYTRLSAERLFSEGRRCRWWDLTVRPLLMFTKIYFFKLGLLDGWPGLALAFFSSVHVFTKYARLKSLQK